MAKRTERSRFRIGELLVHPDRNVVVREGEDVRLEPMWMQVLVYLAEHRGRTISTQELLDKPWAGMGRDENAVQKAIFMLRKKVFLDDPRNPRYIENIHGKGYRLIAPVAWPDDYLSGRGGGSNWRRGNPYVGLTAFDEAHADVFFGRGDAVARVMTAMRAQFENGQRFVLLVGASGSGKTSLLNAGVIPRLTPNGGENGLRALSVARCDLGAAADGDALGALAGAVAGWTLGDRPVLPPQPVASLKDALVESRESIHAAIDESFRRHPVRLDTEPHAHLLLVLDHSEALVATSDRDTAPEQQTAARQALARFVQALETLCDHPRVLATMIVRGDFYPKLMEAVPPLIDRKGASGHVDVARPTAIEINEIITLPAIAAGLEFERDPDTRAVHHLNDTLAEAARGQADVLPLLQHTLHELYLRCAADKKLTYAAYQEIGGLEGAIARRAEEVFASLPSDAQASLDSVLGQLVVIESDSDAIRGKPGFGQRLSPPAKTLVTAFIEARLFAAEGPSTFAVAHEALLRQWPRATEWIDDNRRLLRAHSRLRRATARWLEDDQNKDHLLNSGRPLEEALEVITKTPNQLEEVTLDFVSASEKKHLRQRLLRRSAFFALLAMTIASTFLTILTYRSKLEAEEQRNSMVMQAFAFRKVAEIGFNNAEFGKLEPALKTIIFTLAQAKNKYPKSTNIIAEYGTWNYWLGYLYDQKGETSKAKFYWERYIRSCEYLEKTFPYDSAYKSELSYANNNMGSIALKERDYHAALQYFWKSASLKREILKTPAANDEIRYEYADTISWIGSTEATMGHSEIAIEKYKIAIFQMRRLLEKNPNDPKYTRKLGIELWRYARAISLKGRLDESMIFINESIEKLKDSVAQDNSNDKYKKELANSYLEAGLIAERAGQLALARSHMESAKESIESIRFSRTVTDSWHRLRARIRFEFFRLCNSDSCKEDMDQSISELKRLASTHSDEITYAQDLATAYVKRGNISGDYSYHEKARKTLEPFINVDHSLETRIIWLSASNKPPKNPISSHSK